MDFAVTLETSIQAFAATVEGGLRKGIHCALKGGSAGTWSHRCRYLHLCRAYQRTFEDINKNHKLMTELIWEGKYKDGRRVVPVKIELPFQTIETINESAQERQRTRAR